MAVELLLHQLQYLFFWLHLLPSVYFSFFVIVFVIYLLLLMSYTCIF